ncbi:MAG: hypothetical protein JRI23_32560, partial [Deltaproteobacteria bacterium]|nr:hypothetical protein [Deltaproteobacteria bacterium]MBW2536978.1 hypothetical protein [Deltaproteobacteria bacterium]
AERRRADATSASARVAELEQSLQDLRSQLDRAKARAGDGDRELERSRRRCAELERAAAAADAERREVQAELAARTTRESQLEDALATIAEREAELESKLESMLHELPAEEPSEPGMAPATVRAFEFQIEELRKTLSATRNERDAYQARADVADRLEQDLAAADGAKRQAEERLAQLLAAGGGRGDTEVQEQELTRLERLLQERGRSVAELEARLAESARAGQELLRKLQRTRARRSATDGAGDRGAAAGAAPVPARPEAGGEPRSVPAGPVEAGRSDGATFAALQADHELLRQRAATLQADLAAANWTITGLRHELETAGDDATPESRKLEEALQAARAEIAELRARLRQSVGGSG